MIKKVKENHQLSNSLKKNLKLRKKQTSERDNKQIIGKRLQKIGVSKLDLNDSEKEIKIL